MQELLEDISRIKNVTESRKLFLEVSKEVKGKYINSEFDFEVITIIETVILEISKSIDIKENKWKDKNLTLGDKSRSSVHKWKENIKYLPEYLSKNTLDAINMLDLEANLIISEGKIEDVVFYFEKLDETERKECVSKLLEIINL